jgi:hypothetical protein
MFRIGLFAALRVFSKISTGSNRFRTCINLAGLGGDRNGQEVRYVHVADDFPSATSFPYPDPKQVHIPTTVT